MDDETLTPEQKEALDEKVNKLWEEQGKIATRLVEWFALFRKVRNAESVPAELLIEQIRRADPAMLDHDHEWLLVFLFERFAAKRDHLKRNVGGMVRQAAAAKAEQEARRIAEQLRIEDSDKRIGDVAYLIRVYLRDTGFGEWGDDEKNETIRRWIRDLFPKDRGGRPKA